MICLVRIVEKGPQTEGRRLEPIEAMWVHGDGGAPSGGGPDDDGFARPMHEIALAGS